MNRIQKKEQETRSRKAKAEIHRTCVSNGKRQQAGAELTREGWFFCIMAGMLETVSVLSVLRIDFIYVPVLVFLVLWAAFGIITSAFLIGTGYGMVYYRNVKADMNAMMNQKPFCVPDQREFWNVKKAS